jgi:hypothetical protein
VSSQFSDHISVANDLIAPHLCILQHYTISYAKKHYPTENQAPVALTTLPSTSNAKNHPSINCLPLPPTTTMGKSYAEEEDRISKAIEAYHSGQNLNLSEGSLRDPCIYSMCITTLWSGRSLVFAAQYFRPLAER